MAWLNNGTKVGQRGSGGGGISKQIISPQYQKNITGYSKRTVPDVSGIATSWYLPISNIKLNQPIQGESYSISLSGGTSVVAPMYAAFFIIVNQD